MVGFGIDFGYADPDVDALLEKVRFDLLNPPHNEATDWGLFVSMRPYQIARALTGNDVLEMTLDIDEALLAKSHLRELGQRVGSFYREFMARRERSGRKRGALEPSPDELREAFGADAALVEAAWPMAARIDAILSLRARRDVDPEERAAREAAIWDGGATLVAAGKPNRYVFHPPSATPGGDPELGEGLRGRIQAAVARAGRRRHWRSDVVEDVTQKVVSAFDRDVIKTRLLAFPTTLDGENVGRQFKLLIRSLIRDAAPAPVTLTIIDDDPETPQRVPVAASTIRGYRFRQKIGAGASEDDIERAWREGQALRAHEDPTGAFITGRQLADRLQRKVRTVNKAIADLGLFDKENGGYRVPDRPEVLAMVRAKLGRERNRCKKLAGATSAKRERPPKMTVRQIAEERGVSLDTVRQACRDYERFDEDAVEDPPWGRPEAPRFPMRALSEDAAEALRAVISRYAKLTT